MHLSFTNGALITGIALATFSATPAYAEYEYINTSSKDVIYYGKKVDKVGDTVVIFVKYNDVNAAKKGSFTSAFKCSKKLTDSEDDPSGWRKVEKDTLAEGWMKFACR